jgi:HEAT repeat protein
LGNTGDARAVNPLIAALSDKDLSVCNAAAEALGKIGDARAVKPLIAVLDYSKEQFVRIKAVESLVKIGNPGVKPLIEALKDKNEYVRIGAAEVLDKLGWPAESEQEKIPYLIAERRWSALVSIGAPAVEHLITALRDEDSSFRWAAAEALGQIGDARAVEPLIAALKDNDVRTRRGAAEALEKMGDTRAVEPLIAALKDEDPSVRIYAAKALGNKGDTRAVEPLIAALKDKSARWAAAEALGKIGDTRAVEPLSSVFIAVLKDESTRLGAFEEALKKIGNGATEPLILIQALKDKNEYVRISAVEVLGEIRDTRAIEPLISILNDNDHRVSNKATEALIKIGNTAVEPLIASLKDESVRRNAAKALGRIGDTRAVEPLIAVIKNEAYYTDTAVDALGKIGDGRAVEPLIALIENNDSLTENAVDALGEIGDQRAIPILTSLLRENWYHGLRSATALQRLGWRPESIKDKVHFDVAMKHKSSLIGTWEQTKSVLLEDLSSNEDEFVDAVYAFIDLGKQEIIPELIKTLDSKGSKTMAEVFLNCGQHELSSAANAWAKRKGYNIAWMNAYGSRASSVSWGGSK